MSRSKVNFKVKCICHQISRTASDITMGVWPLVIVTFDLGIKVKVKGRFQGQMYISKTILHRSKMNTDYESLTFDLDIGVKLRSRSKVNIKIKCISQKINIIEAKSIEIWHPWTLTLKLRSRSKVIFKFMWISQKLYHKEAKYNTDLVSFTFNHTIQVKVKVQM